LELDWKNQIKSKVCSTSNPSSKRVSLLFFFASYILQIWLGYPHEFPRRAGEVPDPPSKVQTSPDKESFDKALTKEVFAVAARDCTQTFLETFDK